MKHIYFTVTNDLSYDQRMQRICHSLSSNGYKITLVGRLLNTSVPIRETIYAQERIQCFFNKGLLFYFEYNLRLLFFLLKQKQDAICAIDLDTILPCLFVSRIKSIPVIYDAHEYFTELKEVRTRPFVKWVWTLVEKIAVPRIKYGYTVADKLAATFNEKYKKDFISIKNFPQLKPYNAEWNTDSYLFFGGAVNEARGFEYLVPAMQWVNLKLVIVGDGNFMDQLKDLIHINKVQHKIELKGMQPPEVLRFYAEKATLGIGLAEKEGLNQFLALPNKFPDYIHAGLPQISMDYPEYREINDQYKVAVLIDNLSPLYIAEVINDTMENKSLLQEMHLNTLKAREVYNWKTEEIKLVKFYHQIFID